MEDFMSREVLLLAAVLVFASAMPVFADTFTSTFNFRKLELRFQLLLAYDRG